MKAITVSVDYADLLAITLPRNAPRFSEVVVVTSPADRATQRLCEEVPGVRCHVTEAFYAGEGAVFRKWAALEEGLALLGRDGWIWVLDADILLPQRFRVDAFNFCRGNLYGPRRRMLRNPAEYSDELDWRTLPVAPDREFAGYCQIFNARDPHLGAPPWYQTGWLHAGGGDSFFARCWPEVRRIRPQFEVLHLGEDGKNWCGRATRYADGTMHPDAAARLTQLDEFRRRRDENRRAGRDPYEHERLPQ